MRNYKGISFAEGYNKPFADFKKEFESTHVFKRVPHKEREKALKEAYKIATKDNGNAKGTSRKSKEPEQSED